MILSKHQKDFDICNLFKDYIRKKILHEIDSIINIQRMIDNLTTIELMWKKYEIDFLNRSMRYIIL